MNIRKLNEKLEMFLKENNSLNYNAWESLRNKIQETINGATDVILEDENDTPWIVVWFHELVHLECPNHSREFWDKVGILLPDYENSKDWLTQNGIRLDI
mgnify:CR=1 FL=1